MTDKHVKVGDIVDISTGYSRVIGTVLSIAEYIVSVSDDGIKEVEKLYRIMLSKGNYVDIKSSEIISMKVYEEDKKYVIDMMSSKYGIDCCDTDGNLKDTIPLVKELLDNDVWEHMTEEDKNDLLNIFTYDSTIIDGWSKCHKKANELLQENKRLSDINFNLKYKLINEKSKKETSTEDQINALLALIGIGGALCAIADTCK